MAFLPLKFALATTDFAVLILLVMILIRHTSYKFDIRSWSAGFNILCVVWLAFRGAFWVLTMCSIDYWIGSTFYILFWVPMPISFGAFMLIPLFFAHLLYRVEWEYYWNKIWWIYTFTTIGLAIFMISWSILAAMNLQRDLQCINTAMVTNQSTAECYDTTYSSNAFRAVTAACFLFLACNCAVFGKRILSVNGLEASRYLGPSMEELYKVNMFLFASFLSRGLYECLDVMHVFVLPSIPLKGDEDIAFMTFFVFMLWDYFPTLVWIVTVTGRDVICTGWMTGTVSPREQSPLLSPYRDGISYDRLSELSRFGGSDTIERDRFDENALHFVSADGAQFIGSTVDSAHRARTRRKDIEEVMDGTNMLGRRFVAPSSIAPLSSWLLPSEEIGANIFRGQSYSGSGNSRSLIYGTFGDDVMASSGGSTSGVGNPLHAQFSSSMASSPKMPWPDQNAVAVAPGSQFAMNVDTFNNNRPTLPPPEPSPDKSAGLAPFSSKYYDNDDADAVPGLLVGSNMSPLLRLPNSPARLSINPSLPYLQSLPPSYNQPPEYLLEPAINGQDHLNDIAASFKNGSMWGAGMSPSGTGFTGLPSIRGIRSRSNTNDNSILPPMSPALVPGELPHNIPGIWRPMSSATMQNQRSQLRVVTASNVITKRALTTVNSPRDSPRDMSPVRMDSGSPPSSPLARKRGVSHASYVSSSPDSSAPSHSNGGAGSNSSNSTAPPPPPAVAGVWKQHYFTEDVAAYSESLVEEAAKSPKIAV